MPPPRKNPKHQIPPPEVFYADLISAGIVKVVRRPGKAPLIIWLT
ncbi:hypothetical protein HOU03_gp459 [Caulobacter phage CcrSC]|uniref:Uncharacterized protein n=1 Tax=Caulobacter phage CcrSC TaxID=2283272 RepID=A0A385EG23_9CAUD|nr:hypothetical protein HOU03_gp459 [Caulobacter phage CcrSC]AXQ69808.1 hypothetical protein CcrSC_gp226c [Caulobacter phage CcrSC]